MIKIQFGKLPRGTSHHSVGVGRTEDEIGFFFFLHRLDRDLKTEQNAAAVQFETF